MIFRASDGQSSRQRECDESETSAEQAIAELAKRFDSKSFLPAFGDIRLLRHLWSRHTRIRTRIRIPRVFRIATLERPIFSHQATKRHSSGPSRLGPIAYAIRRNGRVATPRTPHGIIVRRETAHSVEPAHRATTRRPHTMYDLLIQNDRIIGHRHAAYQADVGVGREIAD